MIRVLIVCFSSAGPAINPMLATCWHIFDNGGGQVRAESRNEAKNDTS